MHLYIGVWLRETTPGRWESGSPDLPDVLTVAATSGEALARVRLALEVDIAARLGRGEQLPQVRSLAQLEAASPTGERFYEVHMNLRHLQALARHQSGRWSSAS